jgi:hypothetical protein
MLTMQYRIGLPADYDMGIIRRRIAERGHLTDDFPGLAFKAYLYAEHTAAGGENLYAPFYLWHDTEGMNAFLTGAGFAGVIASFGRPLVRTWSVWHAETAHDLGVARCATREIVPIPAQASLDGVRQAELAALQADWERGALASISAFDPAQWSLLRFRLWRDTVDRPQGDDAEVYAIGHLSQPHP